VSKVTKSPTATPMSRGKTVVLGVGNLLLSDEGVGVHVVKKLSEMTLPSEVEVVEGGVGGLGLMDVVMGADRLIVIDAVKGGGPPGSIYRFEPNDLTAPADDFKMSVHEIGVLEVIRLSGLLGRTPRTSIFGVEPKSMDTGMELSPEIQAKVPKLIELILNELKTAA